MAKNTNIQWTDMTWPITTGCEPVSPGCMNCYAIKDSWRLAHNPNAKVSEPYADTVKKTTIDNQSVLSWTGIVKWHPDRLNWVTPRQKPAMVFVCNMGDLFHKNVPFEFIDRVWEQMSRCSQHTFQVLTKRPERMLEYFQSHPEIRIFASELKTKEKQAQLSELQRLEDSGQIDLYYLDETGFCLIPSVPYAWQNIGEYLSIKSRRSQRLNVLGIMNRKNYLNAYVSTQTINSDVIAACIDSFFPVVERPTFIVVDRASIHTSDFIYDRLEEWKERGINIFELPTYSPELNLIEILWRFIKYEWLEIDAYSSWQSLVSSVEKIIKEFGDNYVINFA